MLKLILEAFISISGITAASGIVYQDRQIHIVSDNSNYIYSYSITDQKLSKTALRQSDPMENRAKAAKMDLESITFDGSRYYLYGSGSTPNRNTRFIWDGKTVLQEDYSNIYSSLMEKFNISKEDFNIEGVVHLKDKILFFNRGNGPKGINAILEYHPLAAEQSRCIPIELPKLNGISTGFSDATLVGNEIYFIATAENAKSTYLDGEISGSLLGKIPSDLSGKPETFEIPEKHKFEGITLKEETAHGLIFLLCEDTDSEDDHMTIYSLRVSN
ncbi:MULTISPECIES: DUF6929 family protein [Sphingobacterium]|mgnify:CR=1 FL=1|uniref:DUF6929 family protein n=1 Tax=Sphingobacterium TaxID=28453 RepID=UPI00095AAA88|nr:MULTISPECIES: hypothetical protein [Sphingobacterium]OJZ13319.1 MAG: hypothetical protein BGP15_16610 [Sphingobacterium sp. 40-24]HAF36407.1 hypothetical protein [Sphingobacterium sp.]HAT93940.1 hypothetical protein [Sphingobacterium sp.]